MNTIKSQSVCKDIQYEHLVHIAFGTFGALQQWFFGMCLQYPGEIIQDSALGIKCFLQVWICVVSMWEPSQLQKSHVLKPEIRMHYFLQECQSWLWLF